MAADLYRSKVEPRPHRAALALDEAAALVRSEVRAGRIDGDAAHAVLRAAGHRARRRREWPAGLTSREVDVLRLVAQGLSQRDIAERLVISRKTASNHVEHVYTKIGASNRAMAALFAVKHGLVASSDPLDGTDQ
jgi:DNA-binding NarL/FixJ family response regulator